MSQSQHTCGDIPNFFPPTPSSLFPIMSGNAQLDADVATQDKWVAKLQKCQYLTEAEVKEMCERAREILAKEQNVAGVKCPVTVVRRYSRPGQPRKQPRQL